MPFVEGSLVPSGYIKYLGIHFDSAKEERHHIATVTSKSVKVMLALSRLIPNNFWLSP